MKLNYYPETDSLYIDGFVLDCDAEGNLVGIDIDNASEKVELDKLTSANFPVRWNHHRINPT